MGQTDEYALSQRLSGVQMMSDKFQNSPSLFSPGRPISILTAASTTSEMTCPMVEKKNNFKSSFQRLFVEYSNVRHFLFPIASCMSHPVHQNDRPDDFNSSDTENLSVPGMQFKRKTAVQSQTISEVEIKDWLNKETGMDRLRRMYAIDHNGMFIEEDTVIMNKFWFRTVLAGFCINYITTTLAKDKEAKRTKNLSATTALKKDYLTRVPTTAMKEALTNTARLSIWAGSLVYISQAIAVYRNKSSVWEYVIASVIGFGTAGLTGNMTMKGLASYTGFGVLCGFIGGQAVCKFMTDNSITQEMRHSRRVKQMLEDQRSHCSHAQ